MIDSEQTSPLLRVETDPRDTLMHEIVNLSRLAHAAATERTAVNLPWPTSTFGLTAENGVHFCVSKIDDAPIAAFNVGGERRVCVPQLVAGLLNDIELSAINSALISLNIHTPLADNRQLSALKRNNILQTGRRRDLSECALQAPIRVH